MNDLPPDHVQASNAGAARSRSSPPETKTPASSASFSYNGAHDGVPEMAITAMTSSRPAALATPAQSNIDLSGRKKVLFFIGRGRTGKTTLIRWVAEITISAGTSLLMADLDPTNDTFSRYVDGVARPPILDDQTVSVDWLEQLLQHALETGQSVAIDLGGGDTTLRRVIARSPALVELFEEAGFAVVALYSVGPREEDLTPLATMADLGFKPTASAIVLNEGLVEAGQTTSAAFIRVTRHSLFLKAVGDGAVPVWMPRLLPAAEVEMRRLHFRRAVDGATGTGSSPLGPFNRARVRHWLTVMPEAFSAILSWLP